MNPPTVRVVTRPQPAVPDQGAPAIDYQVPAYTD